MARWDKKTKKILITGHRGLIGSRLYKYYTQKGYDVYGYEINDRWNNVIQQRYDIIHHCASLCVIRDVIKNPGQMIKNIDITYKVMELARKHVPSKLFLYSSNRVTANIPNPYVTSKRFMEDIAKGYYECYKLSYVVIRPETIWGYKKNDVRVMSNWVEKVLKNQDITLYGDIYKELSPLYVDDFIEQILKIERYYHLYKLRTITITGEERRALDVANQIINYFASESNIKFKAPEIGQPQKVVKRKKDEIRVETYLAKDLERYKIYKKIFGD